uniref:Uncharacterized protein AlNc14C71G4893 n=1 Tax=Albugo laibachii Nc14 TaxID=890382 RepID=F0WE32_9STRA|nr:sporangia induced conserved hypothetical protein [Albugo laibachii Nc14]|eukprot:CCA19461.1 sporangia induced conserved hypothetical protein [Albugo laibachii Nc14]
MLTDNATDVSVYQIACPFNLKAEEKRESLIPADRLFEILLRHVLSYLSVQERWYRAFSFCKRWKMQCIESLYEEPYLDLMIPSHLKQITIESNHVGDDALKELTGCSQLETLVLHCMRPESSTMIKISNACPLLCNVDIAGCLKMDDGAILAIATNSRQMETLNIATCYRLSSAAITSLATRQSRTSIGLNADRCPQISGTSIRQLPEQQPQMKHLSCTFCICILGRAFHSWQQHFPHRKDSTTGGLHSLCFTGHVAMDDLGLAAILKHYQSTLEILHVGTLPKTGPVSVQAIAHCRLIHTLDISRCARITSNDFMTIIQSCGPRLTSLNADVCCQIDDRVLVCISHLCTKLECISLELCYNITDYGLISLIGGCVYLKSLMLGTCSQLTDASFQYMTQHKAKEYPVEYLDIGSCMESEMLSNVIEMMQHRFLIVESFRHDKLNKMLLFLSNAHANFIYISDH